MDGQVKVKIDRGVPYPSRTLKKFPLEEMKIGDSFVADIGDRSLIYYHMKLHDPKRYITRTVRENGHFRLRVWRVL